MHKILIVDDDQDFVNATSLVLSKSGYEVYFELSANSAMGRIKEIKPDLIILDVMFPENPSAGFELAREIQHVYDNLPIIMLTAINEKFPLGFQNEHIDESWLPVEVFLEKPVEFDLLKNKIAEMLDS